MDKYDPGMRGVRDWGREEEEEVGASEQKGSRERILTNKSVAVYRFSLQCLRLVVWQADSRIHPSMRPASAAEQTSRPVDAP